jgi:hypothetical protein
LQDVFCDFRSFLFLSFPPPHLIFFSYMVNVVHILFLLFLVLRVESYALSSHRCCCCFLIISSFVLADEIYLLFTALSIISATNFTSGVLTGNNIITESGIPFLPVKICLFVPNLLLSEVRLLYIIIIITPH